MKTTKLFIRYHALIWVCLFSVITGVFVTGMTGYVTLGSNYPVALIIAITMNLILGMFLLNLKGRLGEVTLFKVLTSFVKGKRGKIISGLVGMVFLLILLMVAASESRSGAYVMDAMIGFNSDLGSYVFLICLIALIPGIFGIRSLLRFSLITFMVVLFCRSVFTIISIATSPDLPPWSVYNLMTSFNMHDLSGTDGILFMGFRLAFWSLVGIEIVSIWNKKGPKEFSRPTFLIGFSAVLVLSLIPGILIAGIFPIELWQLIVSSDVGCYGNCSSIAFGEYMSGINGRYFMGLSSLLTHIAMISICYALMLNLVIHMAKQRLFFAGLSKRIYFLDGRKDVPTNVLLVCFVVIFFLSFVDMESTDWVGLSLYLCFALIAVALGISIFNFQFGWFRHDCIRSVIRYKIALLSLVLFSMMFYSSFKGLHEKYLLYSGVALAFSIGAAFFSLHHLLRAFKR